jgi:hypothetical protein
MGMGTILTFSKTDSCLVALLAVFLLVGCDPHVGPASGPRPSGAETQPRAHAMGLDSFFAQIAQKYPAFGGASVEDGKLTVYMASDRPSPPASPLASSLHSRLVKGLELPARFEKRSLAVRRVRYSYDQLVAWRHMARPVVFTSPGVHGLDIRERENRIAVETGQGAQTVSIIQQLREAGIPRSALRFEETTPTVQMSTLRDRHAHVRGGHQIEFGESSVCTAGFSAYFDDEPAYVTASHCTDVPGAVTGTVHMQGGRRIGQEVLDPRRTSALSGCPAGHMCRYSDVAIGLFDTPTDFGYATLARPVVADPLAGPVYLSPNDPIFPVWDEATYPTLGETLHKIGRTTGWTYGEVIATCLDLRVSENVTLLCQDRVAAGVNGGDSGAPVFSIDDANATRSPHATLYGVLWGRAGDSFLFSSLHNIRADIRRTSGHSLRLHAPLLQIPEAEPGDSVDDAYTK